MTKKTIEEIKAALHINGENLNTPTYISPNGGSLQGVQDEIKAVYALIGDIIDSLKLSAWAKGGTE